MARAVYSTRFLELSGSGSVSGGYTVPAGQVAIVRDVRAFLYATTSSSAVVRIGATGPIFFYALGISANDRTEGEEMRVVLQAGEVIEGQLSSTGAQYLVVSGYLLPM